VLEGEDINDSKNERKKSEKNIGMSDLSEGLRRIFLYFACCLYFVRCCFSLRVAVRSGRGKENKKTKRERRGEKKWEVVACVLLCVHVCLWLHAGVYPCVVFGGRKRKEGK
jgi:hypothetical protein